MLLNQAVTPTRMLFSGGAGVDPASLSSAVLVHDTYDEQFLRLKSGAGMTAANSESLSSSSAQFKPGNEDFSYTFWFKPTDLSVASWVIGVWEGGAGNQRSWGVQIPSGGLGAIRFFTNHDGTVGSNVQCDSSQTLSLNTWHLITIYHDSVNDEIGIKVDNNPFDTVSTSNGCFAATTADFHLGGRHDAIQYCSGEFDSLGKWSKVISNAEADAIYNSGEGQNLAQMDKTGLTNFWKLNEVSGTRYDSIGGLHLVDNNTVPQVGGKIKDEGTDHFEAKAAQFTRANNEYLSSTDTIFHNVSQSFSFCGMVRFDDLTTSSGLVSKFSATGNNKQYGLRVTSTTIQFRVSEDGSTNLNAVSTVTPALNTWHFMACVYDYENGLAKISVDGENFQTIAAADLATVSALFTLGRFGDTGAPLYQDGRMQNWAYYRAALTQAQVNTIYNGGAGQKYDDILKTNLVAFWKLDEVSGTRYDSHGNYNLTDNNTVTQNGGVILDTKITTYDVAQWLDRSGNEFHSLSDAVAARPEWDGNELSGDGTAVEMLNTAVASTIDPHTEGEVVFVVRKNLSTSYGYIMGYGEYGAGGADIDFRWGRNTELQELRKHTRINADRSGVAAIDSTENANDFLVVSFYVSGGAPGIAINGIDVTDDILVGAGTSNLWFSTAVATADTLTLFRVIQGSGFGNISLKAVSIFDTALGNDRAGVHQWYNSVYSVYTEYTKLSEIPNLEYYNKVLPTPMLVNGDTPPYYYKNATVTRQKRATSLTQEDIAGILDTLNLTYSNVYTSNFATVDGWTPDSNTVLEADATYNNESGWLKATDQGTGATTKGMAKTFLTSGKFYRMRARVVVDDLNTIVDGFMFYTSSSVVRPEWREIGAGEYEVDFHFHANNATLNLWMLDGGGASPNQAGEEVLVKDMIVDEVTGYHFIQTTNGNKSEFTADGNYLDIDGVSNTYSSPTLFTGISTDLQGAFYFEGIDDAGIGNDCYQVTLSDGTVSNYILIGIGSSDDLILIRENAGTNTVNFGSITRSALFTYLVGSKGSDYHAYKGFYYRDVDSGADDGEFIGDNGSLDRIELFRQPWTPTYWAQQYKTMAYFSVFPTAHAYRSFKQISDLLT